MNLWEKILQMSGLPECNSIAQHLCNISSGTNTYVVRAVLNGAVNKIEPINGLVKKEHLASGEAKKISSIKGIVTKNKQAIGVVTKVDNLKGSTRCHK